MIIVLRGDSSSDLRSNKLNITAGQEINRGDITTHHAGWLHRRIFGCFAGADQRRGMRSVFVSWQPRVCGRDGALLQFVQPCFIYTLTKSRRASVKHELRDVAALMCYVAPTQVGK